MCDSRSPVHRRSTGPLLETYERADPNESTTMYQRYYGFSEKHFSLTPDPKFLFRSETHGGALELLERAIRRREGFVAITGDIGTGKTTLCRALLERLDPRTFSTVVPDPCLSAADLLPHMLQDFGVVSRDAVADGRVRRISEDALIDTLNRFLLSLLPLRGCALLLIDNAQTLSPHVLEQIRVLSNLETDEQKLLQIVLVGRPDLTATLRASNLRQRAQRVSTTHTLQPLTRDEVAAYVLHRLTVTGGGSRVVFQPRALEAIHRLSRGVPRAINLRCDRALLAGFACRTSVIDADMVDTAAERLDPPGSRIGLEHRRRPRTKSRASLHTGGATDAGADRRSASASDRVDDPAALVRDDTDRAAGAAQRHPRGRARTLLLGGDRAIGSHRRVAAGDRRAAGPLSRGPAPAPRDGTTRGEGWSTRCCIVTRRGPELTDGDARSATRHAEHARHPARGAPAWGPGRRPG